MKRAEFSTSSFTDRKSSRRSSRATGRGYDRDSRDSARDSSRSFNRSARSSSASRRGGFSRKPSFNKRGQKPVIDVASFIRKATSIKPAPAHIIKHTFADFDFSEKLQKNLERRNYTTPTPIQDQSIKHIVDGRDLVGLANTGTGKTAAFLLPLIDRIEKDRSVRVLVIAPTRELALQIDKEFRQFSIDMKIFSSVCIGGTPMYHQLKSLKRNPNVIIGTPGRLKDMYDRKALDLSSINNIVLDEVDRMLDMGFINIIRELMELLPDNRQSLFFSATMPEPISKLVHQFLNDPITVAVQTGMTTQNVQQDTVKVADELSKFDTLNELLSQPEFEKVLIFSETKRSVEKLTIALHRQGHKVDSIHGDKRQKQRQRSLKQFSDDRVNILVATDVAARGLDIKDVTHVINYTVPQTYDDYIHRIGRTGRGKNTGVALTFI